MRHILVRRQQSFPAMPRGFTTFPRIGKILRLWRQFFAEISHSGFRVIAQMEALPLKH